MIAVCLVLFNIENKSVIFFTLDLFVVMVIKFLLFFSNFDLGKSDVVCLFCFIFKMIKLSFSLDIKCIRVVLYRLIFLVEYIFLIL